MFIIHNSMPPFLHQLLWLPSTSTSTPLSILRILFQVLDHGPCGIIRYDALSRAQSHACQSRRVPWRIGSKRKPRLSITGIASTPDQVHPLCSRFEFSARLQRHRHRRTRLLDEKMTLCSSGMISGPCAHCGSVVAL